MVKKKEETTSTSIASNNIDDFKRTYQGNQQEASR